MEIEDVTRKRFAPWRSTENERELPVSGRLLRKVVVHAQRWLPLVVHEVLGHRATGVRRDVLHRRGIRRAGDDHDRVLHRARLAKPFDHGGDGGILLPNRDVDADDAGALLVDDRVDRDRGLAGSSVADDQLALSAADGDHGIDRLDTCLERLFDGLPDDDPGRFGFDFAGVFGVDRAGGVERTTEWIHNPTDELLSNGNLEHASGTAYFVPFLELEVIAEDYRADIVFFEIEGERGDLLARLRRSDLEHLASHRLTEPVDARDAVLHFEHGPYFLDVQLVEVRRLDLAEEYVLDFAWAKNRLSGHDLCALNLGWGGSFFWALAGGVLLSL